MSHRRLVLAAGASVVVLLSATPAFAAWSASGKGSAAAKGATFAITLNNVVRTKCNGANNTLTINWTAGAQTPNNATVNIFRGTSAGGEGTTAIATSTAGAGSFDDTNASSSSSNFYKVQVANGTNWKSALSGEVSTTSC